MVYELFIDDEVLITIQAPSVQVQFAIFFRLISKKLLAPLYYEREEDWFYLTGVIELKENGEMMDFTMDGKTVFSFPSTQTEVKLKQCPTSKCVFLVLFIIYIFL